jgi:TRAP transporter TAXI family solute receptor
MFAPDQVASRIPQWSRALLVGCFVILVTGAGLFAYRHFTAPKTITIAVASSDSEAGRVISVVSGLLTKSGARVRLKMVETGGELEASEAFSAGKVDLGIVRADVGDLSAARTVVLVTYGVVMIMVPPGSPVTRIEDLKGKTVGVIGGDVNRRVVEVLTQEYDLARSKVRFKDLSVAEVQQALQSKQVAALLVVAAISEKYLTSLRSFFPANAKRKPGLVPIDSAEAIANAAQAYESYDLPKGSLRGSPPLPEDDLTTLRIPVYLVANKNLDADEVTDLTRTIMDARRDLRDQYPFLTHISAPSTDKDAYIPIHPGAAAFYDDSQKTFLDKYSDEIYYIPMLLGILASFVTAAWKFVRVEDGGKVDNPMNSLFSLAGPIRDARSEADLTAIEEKIDEILKAELARHAKGERQIADSAALSLAAQRLEQLIESRRTRLTTGAGAPLPS